MAMKFRAHDTFFIRKGWLSKGMKYVQKKPDVFVAKDENPMDVLGIGANMVKALRYWLQAVGLTEEPSSGKRVQTFTSLGNSVFTNDRYIEELGTLYLLHYRLSSNKDEATAWYFFFNEFNMTEFSRDDFVEFLQRRIRMEEGEVSVAIRSLNDDFSCIINTHPLMLLIRDIVPAIVRTVLPIMAIAMDDGIMVMVMCMAVSSAVTKATEASNRAIHIGL